MINLKEAALDYAQQVYQGAILCGLTEREAIEAATLAYEEKINDC